MIHPHLPEMALSIRQPWVWAIFEAGKRIENRDWLTRFRGPVCIHAAQACTQREYASATEFMGRFIKRDVPSLKALRRGGIVGTAVIVDCVTQSDDPWFMGRYGFVLDEVKLIEFMPCKGALNFFDWRSGLISGADPVQPSLLDVGGGQ